MHQLPMITAQDNPAVKLFRKLANARKERKKSGLFVLEGLRLVQDACHSGAALTQIFWTEAGYRRWIDSGMALPDGVSGALVSETIANGLAQTEHSQGVFAICRIPPSPPLQQLLRPGGTYGVLYQLQDPGNAGMILRTADALGLDGLVYSACCDIYSPKVVRATMGSLFRVPLWVSPEIGPVLSACQAAGIETCAAVVDPDAEPVGQCAFRPGTAILIGNEGNGLPDEVALACDRQVTIPMHGTIESLNAAMAAGIILWEATRGKMGDD